MRPELIVGLGFGLALAPPALVVQAQTAEELYTQGRAAYNDGRYAEAADLFAEVVRLEPDNEDAYVFLGLALRRLGQLEDAVAAYQSAIDLDPSYAIAYINLGVALRRLGQLEDAVAAFQSAIDLDPDYAIAYYNLGIALRDLGQLEEAVAAFQSAIDLDPDYAGAYNNLGIALRDLGQLEEAVAAYQTAINIEPAANRYNNLGVALRGLGQLEEAVAAYQSALDLDPDLGEAYNNWGYLLYTQGNYTAAIEKYEAALAIDPNLVKAQTNLDQARRDLLLQTTPEPTEQQELAWLPDTASLPQLRAVVRVIAYPSIGSDRYAATGWVVKREGDQLWVVTNRHVIQDTNVRLLSPRIEVEFYSRPPEGEVRLRRSAELLYTTDPGDPRDLAVLLITNSPAQVDPLPLAPTLADLGTEVDIYGHHTAAYWDLARGFVGNNQDGSNVEDGNGQRLTISQATVSEGSSGSPVLDRATGQVIGMMVEIDQLDPRLGENFVGSRSYAIPSAAILDMLSQWGIL